MHKKSSQLFVLVLFAIISAYFNFSFYPLGSNEATLLVSKKPAVIDWSKFVPGKGQSPQEILGDDTFLTFKKDGPLINENLQAKPSLYIRGSDSLIPIFMQTRTGALPHYLNRIIAGITTPAFSLGFFAWLMGFLAFGFSFLYVESASKAGLLYGAFAIITPQIVYFLGPSFQDFHASLAVILGALLCLQRGSTRRSVLIAALLLGFSVYLKLASAIFIPMVLLLHWEIIKLHRKYFFLPLIILVAAFCLLINWNDLLHILVNKRRLVKESGYHFMVWKEFFFYLFVPHDIFPLIFKDPLTAKVFSQGWSIVTVILSLGTWGLIIFKYVSSKKALLMAVIMTCYLFIVGTISVAPNEDLFSYLSQGICLLMLFLFASIKVVDRRLMYLTAFLIFLKVPTMISWTAEFQKVTKSSHGASWIYEDMEKEISRIIGKSRLITMNYLDVGQFEFYSKENLIPLHVYWKFGQPPTPEMLQDFLIHFPEQEYFVLQSYGSDGKDWNSYIGKTEDEVRGLLDVYGMNVVDVGSYSYPEFGRSYRLVKLTKKL